LAETRGEAGEIGAWASDGGGGWWVVCVDVDVLWKREAHAVLGARKLWMGCGRARGIVRTHERVPNIADAIVAIICLYNRNVRASNCRRGEGNNCSMRSLTLTALAS
jgi:hypothetical protein